MKDKIINSNKYKRYVFYLKLFSGMYILFAIIFMALGSVQTVNHDSIENYWNYVGLMIIFLTVIHGPFILFYGITLISMKKNAEAYKIYIGLITSIETSRFVRIDYREIDIKVEEIKESLQAKIYLGELYDEVAKNVKIEIAYNEETGDVIVLRVV